MARLLVLSAALVASASAGAVELTKARARSATRIGRAARKPQVPSIP